MNRKKTITVIMFPERIVIHGENLTDSGIGIADETSIKEFGSISEKEFLNYLKILVNQDVNIIKHPSDWKLVTQKYYDGLHIKSHKQYMDQTKVINI